MQKIIKFVVLVSSSQGFQEFKDKIFKLAHSLLPGCLNMSEKYMTLQQKFASRRRKEDEAGFVVDFLKAYSAFNDIYQDYKSVDDVSELKNLGLYERVEELDENLIMKIKDRAHELFRHGSKYNKDFDETRLDEKRFADLERILDSAESKELDSGKPEEHDAETEALHVLSDLRKSLMKRSLDSYVGTGFHVFRTLRENLYEIENYFSEQEKEHSQVRRLEKYAQRFSHEFSEKELAEIEHIRSFDDLSYALKGNTATMLEMAFEWCDLLFKGNARILRDYITESGDNEVLTLNLLLNKNMVDNTYGEDEAEDIFSKMYKDKGVDGQSGIEKAKDYVLKNSGNVEELIKRQKL